MAIKTIAIVHHVHTDFGYTDHPCRTKQEHVKYINQAVDYVLESADYPEGARFAWTQEQLYPVRQWWHEASERRKERFFEAVNTKRLEITGTPFNVTAFMNREEWETAMHWIPDDLWDACGIRSIMQIDVNGMHTGGMVCAYNRGIRNLFIGPNSYYGAPPLPTPTAFNWKIDEGKQLFVWLNSSYNNGTFLFNENWRQGPVPNYSDLRYRKPEAGDIWASDDASIMKSYELCRKNLAMLEASDSTTGEAETDGFTKNRVFGGYALETLIVSVTSQWRVDNDPPFYPIVNFVKRWNELGLQPALVLTTASQAMDMVKEELGDKIPTYSGEWIDWWANGNASAPMEMHFNREAKRLVQTAQSSLFGPLSPEHQATVRAIMENICMYDEHCFSSWQSVSNPYSFANLSQTAEKNIYVYRALDGAQCLLADRTRPLAENMRNRILLWNPSQKELVKFIELPLNCMRGEYHSVFCEETGEVWPITYTDGIANFLRPTSADEFSEENVSRTFSDKCQKQSVRFGPVTIPPMGRLVLVPKRESAEQPPVAEKPYHLEMDTQGWPVVLKFASHSNNLIDGIFGQFVSVRADGIAPRWTFKDIFENDDPAARQQLREKHLFETEATYGTAVCHKTEGQLKFEQPLYHDSLEYGKRILTVDLISARAELEFKMNRKSNFAPEVLMLRFDAPESDVLPWVSNADSKFRPERDQFPGSCMDFYAIDGWVNYPNGWFMNSTDAALLTFGSTSVVARKTTTMGKPNRLYFRLFDNIWDTNFNANACGMMQFRFAVTSDIPLDASAVTAENMDTEPIVLVKMGYHTESER